MQNAKVIDSVAPTNLQSVDLVTADDSGTREFHSEVDNVTETEWCALMDDFDDANIYQSWAYGAVRWGGDNLSHLVLKCDGEVVAMAQLRIIRPAHLRAGVAYLRWGPLCHRRNTELNRSVVFFMASALRDEYVMKRGLYLEVLPNTFSDSPRAELFGSAFRDFETKPGSVERSYRTFVLNLDTTLNELHKKLDKKWRNQLNAAMRNGLEIVEDDTSENYREFCALYKQMWQRKKFDSAVNIDEFRRIQERLPKAQRLKILICRHEGTAVAGLVCSALGASAIYLLGATNEDGMKMKASYLLQWATIQLLKERGTRRYDLGGIDPVLNPGVHHFKKGLSGADVSHMGALIACENSFSAALVKLGSVLRFPLRALQQRASRGQLSELR
jgi:lipid II:glycine glycyltransferase (peptidoglycan interpeptide bridge formation enzyme)